MNTDPFRRVNNNDLAEYVYNFNTMRKLIRDEIDPRRSIGDSCGHPDEITLENYTEMYERDAVSARVVEVMPKESWQITPSIVENEDDDETEFERAWKELQVGEPSWLEGDNPVWEVLTRADILSGVGHYGVILIGVDDGRPLSDPVENGDKLLYLRAFTEAQAPITKFETEPLNPRYGSPVQYEIQFESGSQTVHWTRIIHIADNRQSSDVIAVPRMRPVFNRLLDLRKLYGSSAEMYWQGAFPGFSIESQPDLDTEVDLDAAATQEAIEKYTNSLQRWMSSIGFTVKSLAPQVSDPTAQIVVQLEAICIEKGVPKRVFMGTERGELASSQDAIAWQSRVSARRTSYLTPKVIAPFIDRLINIGILPTPSKYSVVWGEIDLLSEEEKALVQKAKAEALSAYTMGMVEAIVGPHDFLTRIMEFTADEADEILANSNDVLLLPKEEEDAFAA